jgi:hypothetical protein
MTNPEAINPRESILVARGGDDVLGTGVFKRSRVKAHTFHTSEVELAVDMVRTVFLNRKVVDYAQSTRDIDQFT